MAASWRSRARRKGLESPLARCLCCWSESGSAVRVVERVAAMVAVVRFLANGLHGGWPRHWGRSPCWSPATGWRGSGERPARPNLRRSGQPADLGCSSLFWLSVAVQVCRREGGAVGGVRGCPRCWRMSRSVGGCGLNKGGGADPQDDG